MQCTIYPLFITDPTAVESRARHAFLNTAVYSNNRGQIMGI